jgi:hypothetical protein
MDVPAEPDWCPDIYLPSQPDLDLDDLLPDL